MARLIYDSGLPGQIENFIKAVDAAEGEEPLFSSLQGRLFQLGFDHYAYWLMWGVDGVRQSYCVHNYPDDWSTHYLQSGYARDDYVGLHGMVSTIPFLWQHLPYRYRLTERQSLIFSEAAEAGLREGATVPVHGPGKAKAMLSVASARIAGEDFKLHFEKYRHEVHLMATYAHEKVIALGLYKAQVGMGALTPREIEILGWTAQGKSRWEAGKILGISEETVKTHLEKARSKLGAANTTHAITIAFMRGLIIP